MKLFDLNKEIDLLIPGGDVSLGGSLYIPDNALGLVLFVHGSGSSRFSVRNQYVSRLLNKANLATLLFDLLTTDEESIDNKTREYRFDIAFLSSRLLEVAKWCRCQPTLNSLSIGYFGASTGAAAALVAAARKPDIARAVVSRGGRPDLAGDSLPHVQAPTLLIVGGQDEIVIEMNKEAMTKLSCIKKMEIVPEASHLFEEPGALDKVAQLANSWYVNYL